MKEHFLAADAIPLVNAAEMARVKTRSASFAVGFSSTGTTLFHINLGAVRRERLAALRFLRCS